MQKHLAVVIPYFQRTAGVLAPTLQAVFAQEADCRLHVIVVDDESPWPVESELTGLDETARSSIRVLKQQNAGSAGARNKGLASLPAEAEFVAVLDSDDHWHPQHITRALAAFEHGYDLYFSDHRREASDRTRFAQCGIGLEGHRLIDAAQDLYCWNGDLFDQVLKQMFVGPSTIVYRRAVFPEIRFNLSVGLTDDMYFVLELAHATDRIAFSPREEVVCMEGENISQVTDWRSNKSLRLILSLSLGYSTAMRNFPLTAEQRTFVRHRLRKYRWDFVTTATAMLRAGIGINRDYVLRFLRHDPAAFAAVPAVLAAEVLRFTKTALKR